MPWRNHTQRAVSFICECMDRQSAGAVSFITAASEKAIPSLLGKYRTTRTFPIKRECTGGSVLSGETSLQGAIREVKEELGILLTPGSEKLIYQTRRENVQDFYDVWLFHRDIKIEEMRLQETEVVDVQWVSSDKLFEMFRLKQLHPLITYVEQLIG